MSFLGGLFGSNGSNFQAQGAQIINPYGGQNQTAAQAVNASQNAIGQQQALAQALAGQNGIGNQSALYNQFGNIASGQGPNPAAAMLSQQTGQNVANQAALMAGQRGASQNAGLIARQAAQQGAATQQQAVGQAATMQANQSLAALGQQAGIASQQVGNQMAAQNALTGASQAQAGQLINENTAQNQANIANAQQQNTANAGIAAQNAQGQQGLLGNVAGGIGSAIGLAHGGMIPGWYADGGSVNDFSNVNTGSYSSANSGPSSAFGKSMSGGGSNYWQSGQFGRSLGMGLRNAVSSLFQPIGGSNPIANQAMANTQASSTLLGGNPVAGPSLGANTQLSQPTTALGVTNSAPQGSPSLGADTQLSDQGASLMAGLAHGGRVPAMVSAGEKYLPPSEVSKVAKGQKRAIDAGETIHGKAKVPGDSIKNDTIPKTLKEGGIVLPRSVTQSKNPGAAAQKFVETLLAKQKGKRAA
jgi:hypothetical protein